MAFYEDLTRSNIFEPIMGKYKIVSDATGKPKVYLPTSVSPQNPWINTRARVDRHCDLWTIYHQLYGIIPAGCRQCWKVVMVVPTLRQAMKILEFQKSRKLEYNCKIGMETRAFTGKIGKFGAYWYGMMDEGLAGGRRMYSDLLKEFPASKLTLKRGCTEFEMAYSPSDRWDEIAEIAHWDEVEAQLNNIFVQDIGVHQTLEDIQELEVATLKRWVEFAAGHGDETYLEFVDKPLTVGYLQYNGSKHNEKDFQATELPEITQEVLHGIQGWVKNNHRSEDADRPVDSIRGHVALVSELSPGE